MTHLPCHLFPQDRGPWSSLRPLLRLCFHAWRFRSAAQRVSALLPRRLRARRQLLRDWRLLRNKGEPKMAILGLQGMVILMGIFWILGLQGMAILLKLMGF